MWERQDTINPREASELEAPLLGRAYLYLLFHKAFGGKPDRAFLDVLLSDATLDVVNGYADDNATMCGLARFLLELRQRDERELAVRVQSEFERYFVGPMAQPACPYESPYRTNEATLFQANTEDVRAIYRAHGLLPKGYLHVPDDHVALMCAFMARLATETLSMLRAHDLDAMRGLLGQQASFVGEHLANWTPQYALQARAERMPVLYPQLIEAFSAFTLVDDGFLSHCMVWSQGRDSLPDVCKLQLSATVREAFMRLDALDLAGLDDYELGRISS